MRNALAWIALVVVAVILIIAGATGRIGSVMAAFITPTQLQDTPS